MDFSWENLALAGITLVAWLVIPPLLWRYSPLKSIVFKRRQILLADLDKCKRASPVTVNLIRAWWLELAELVFALGILFGLPLLVAIFGGHLLPRLFHPQAEIIFPLGGEFILLTAGIFISAPLAMVLKSLILLKWPHLGQTVAAKEIRRALIHFGELSAETDKQDQWLQTSQLAEDYDLFQWVRIKLQKQLWVLAVMSSLALPFILWSGFIRFQVTPEGVQFRSASFQQGRYTWEEVTEIEISVEDVSSSSSTRQAATFTFSFLDGKKVEVWSQSLTSLTKNLRASCAFARANGVSVFISPVLYGRLDYFNSRFQKQILEVAESPECAPPILDLNILE